MDFYTFLDYLTGLHFIKPNLEAATLLPTALLIQFLDAFLCWLIAAHTGRKKELWSVAGLLLGIWALATLFLLNSMRQKAKDN